MSLVIGAQVYGPDDLFLGDLVPESLSVDSVCNQSGDYGSETSATSIRNSAGEYGSPDGNQSAFSLFATDPPVVMLGSERLGVLTVSPFFVDAINPHAVLKELQCD